MNNQDEPVFRIVFGIFWLLNLVVRIYFQLKAQGAIKAFSRVEKQARLGFRVLALAYLFLPVYCFTSWIDFAHADLSMGIRWILGVAILAIYLFLFAWSHRILGKHWSGLVEIHSNHMLITDGPYRYVRHPMYSAFFISTVGLFFLSANWLVFGFYFLATTFMYYSRIDGEEKMMIEHFGDSYAEYMSRTGRILPKILH